MQFFDVSELVHKVYQQVYIAAVADDTVENPLRTFVPLTSLSRRSFAIATAVLWRELPSPAPLLHLLPDQAVEKQFEHKQWSYTFIRSPLESELQRLHLYTPLIRAICAYDHRLNNSAALAFDALLQGLIMTGPLLPNLYRLKLVHPNDHLLAHIHLLLHDGLQVLQLPYYSLRLESTVSALIAASPPLRRLQYVDNPLKMQQFVQTIHQFAMLQDLTIPLLNPPAMKAIASLKHLMILGIVINDSLTERSILSYPFTFDHHLSLLKIMIQRSILITSSRNGIVNNGFDSVRALLRALPIPCHRLAIWLPCNYGGAALADFIACLMVDFESQSDDTFSPSDLRGVSFKVIRFEPRMTTPLPSNFLNPLSSSAITYIDMGDFCTCSLDDDALENLSSSMPNLQTLILGTNRYWSAPPMASLAGLSAVLRYCPALKTLGLVFNCSIGTLQYALVPVNRAITTLMVGVSPAYNPNFVFHFLSRALPHLSKICVEPYDDQESSDQYPTDRMFRAIVWHRIASEVDNPSPGPIVL